MPEIHRGSPNEITNRPETHQITTVVDQILNEGEIPLTSGSSLVPVPNSVDLEKHQLTPKMTGTQVTGIQVTGIQVEDRPTNLFYFTMWALNMWRKEELASGSLLPLLWVYGGLPWAGELGHLQEALRQGQFPGWSASEPNTNSIWRVVLSSSNPAGLKNGKLPALARAVKTVWCPQVDGYVAQENQKIPFFIIQPILLTHEILTGLKTYYPLRLQEAREGQKPQVVVITDFDPDLISTSMLTNLLGKLIAQQGRGTQLLQVVSHPDQEQRALPTVSLTQAVSRDIRTFLSADPQIENIVSFVFPPDDLTEEVMNQLEQIIGFTFGRIDALESKEKRRNSTLVVPRRLWYALGNERLHTGKGWAVKLPLQQTEYLKPDLLPQVSDSIYLPYYRPPFPKEVLQLLGIIDVKVEATNLEADAMEEVAMA